MQTGIATLPPRPSVHEAELRVLSNDAVNAEYRHMVLEAPARILDCAPGQFFHLLCPEAGGEHPFLRRPMSIYGFDAGAERLEFLYKLTGAGTRALGALRAGDRLDVLGPLGHGFTLREDWRGILLVARGVGLATLAPLAEAAQARGIGLTAICSARSPDLLMSVDRFRAAGARVLCVTDTEGTSDMENLRRLIEAEIAAGRVDAMFTCGSRRMLALLQEIGAEQGIPGEIALEQQMACGLGMCHCCVRPFRRAGGTAFLRVCREGPVFPLAEALPW